MAGLVRLWLGAVGAGGVPEGAEAILGAYTESEARAALRSVVRAQKGERPPQSVSGYLRKALEGVRREGTARMWTDGEICGGARRVGEPRVGGAKEEAPRVPSAAVKSPQDGAHSEAHLDALWARWKEGENLGREDFGLLWPELVEVDDPEGWRWQARGGEVAGLLPKHVRARQRQQREVVI